MMNRLRIFLRGIDPALEHFQYEKVIPVHKTGIDYLALEIGETFGHQWRRHPFGRPGRQSECRELVEIVARAVGHFHDFGRRLPRRPANDPFPGWGARLPPDALSVPD